MKKTRVIHNKAQKLRKYKEWFWMNGHPIFICFWNLKHVNFVLKILNYGQTIPTSLMMIKNQVMLSCNFVLFCYYNFQYQGNKLLFRYESILYYSMQNVNLISNFSRYSYEDWIKSTMLRFVRKYLFRHLFIYYLVI